MARFVIMGVAGCGKSTVGEALAGRGAITYADGDDLHPPENIAKMSSGQPLDDNDRRPWLIRVGQALAEGPDSAAIGCSALKRAYRDLIRDQVPGEVHFLHLAAPKEVIAARMAVRKGHFMPLALLDSQFAALEQLDDDEMGAVVDISHPVDAVVDAAEAYVRKVGRSA